MQRIYDLKIGGMARNIAEVHGEIGGTIMTFAEIFVINNSIIRGSAGLLGGALFININNENPKKLYLRMLNTFFDQNMA
jgi:hypothetical protein